VPRLKPTSLLVKVSLAIFEEADQPDFFVDFPYFHGLAGKHGAPDDLLVAHADSATPTEFFGPGGSLLSVSLA
jgi:hypothetical protein